MRCRSPSSSSSSTPIRGSGLPATAVSSLSFVEQGYHRDADEAAVADTGAALAEELERLNDRYEAVFGFRYCVFVAGRSRASLVPELRAAVHAGRDAEIARALDAVVAIAADRYRKARLARRLRMPRGGPRVSACAVSD